MRLTVLGATGRTGGHLLQQALDEGHQVTAVVRDPARLAVRHPALTVVRADVTDPDSLRPAIAGQDAVLSALGPSGRGPTTITSTAARTALTVLDAAAAPRFVAVSAVPVGPPDPTETLLYRTVVMPLVRGVLRETYRDLTRMEQEITASKADWTVVRPPRLLDKPLTGRYRTAHGTDLRHGHAISRADLAHAMLAMLEDPQTHGQIMRVAY